MSPDIRTIKPIMDTTALEKAIERLRDILNQERNEYVRDGVVQRFEFTFELCWKALKRVLALEGLKWNVLSKRFVKLIKRV